MLRNLTTFITLGLLLAAIGSGCITIRYETQANHGNNIEIGFETPISPQNTTLKTLPAVTIPTRITLSETPSPLFTPIPLLLPLTSSVGNNHSPSFSPDGSRMIFISTRDGNPEIYLMTLDGSQQIRLTYTPNVYEDVPSFSPDGRMIIFGGNDGHDEEIYVMNLDSSQIVNLSNSPDSNEGRPNLIPGNFVSLKVIFDSDRSGNWEIYLADLEFNILENVTRITNRPDYADRRPFYIPTTKKILFRSVREASQLYLINLDGTNLLQISQLQNGKNDYYPVASNDGKWILFASDRDGNTEIYAMKLDGTSLENITNDPAQEDTAAISPDNNWIVFSSNRSGAYQLYRVPFTPSFTSAPTIDIDSTWVRPADGMVMVYVQDGEFSMGSNDFSNAEPIHNVYLNAYWIDKTDVTKAMFQVFVNDTGYVTEAEKDGTGAVFNVSNGIFEDIYRASWRYPFGPTSSMAGLENHPVVQVSWNDAKAYCEWAGMRLPIEAEWEKAARGKDGRPFPWGNQYPAKNLLNFADLHLNVDWNDKTINDGYQFTSPAGSYPEGASPYGALDMAGNVWQWLADWYDANYYSQSPENNPQGPVSGQERVFRGGSWLDNVTGVCSAFRHSYAPNEWNNNIGFRCARSAIP